MILSVEGLEFKYPSHKVLNDVSFTLNKGECVAILGTNGTGKSTLLKCINRILKPQNGNVSIGDTEISDLTQLQLAKQIAYVAQTNNTVRNTVFDSVLIGRRPYIKWDATSNDINIVNKALKALELEDYALRYVDELSGGEFQKVIIARALAQEPQVLMLDEPTASLDLKNQLEVVNIIKNVVRNHDMAAIVTIHDLNLALRLADKFIFLKEGEIYAAGDMSVINAENIESVYSVPVKVEYIEDKAIIIPQ